MSDVSKQLRMNADFVLGGTGLPPDAAIAGALQMGADEIDRLTRELDEAKKENERLRHPSCVPYAGAEVVCKERDALRTQVAELKSRLAEAKRENERLTIERNYWYGATAAAIEQKKALGPLPAAPNEAGK